jgi:glycosyltransferase involved in cell wall biosynthesis
MVPDTQTWTLQKDVQERLKDKFCLLYSGHFTHAKGLDLLIEAVTYLPEDCKSRLTILLAGGTSADLKKIADYDTAIFHPVGFVPNEQIISLYKLADCFVLPTRSDTWALVVNEAVVAGCPVMVSKFAGSAGELIEDGSSGIVFDPLDTKNFARKLIFCINNKDRLLTYAQQAKKKLAEYNNDVSAERFVELLTQTGAPEKNIYN